MFGPFGSSKSLSDTMDILNYVTSNDYNKTKNYIESKSYTSNELNNMYDAYNNNLLHLATMSGNAQMVGYFLDKGISFTRQNKFKQTAWDLSTILRKEDVIEKYVEYR